MSRITYYRFLLFCKKPYLKKEQVSREFCYYLKYVRNASIFRVLDSVFAT